MPSISNHCTNYKASCRCSEGSGSGGNLLSSSAQEASAWQDLHTKDNDSSPICAGNYVQLALFRCNMLMLTPQSVSLLFELPVYPSCHSVTAMPSWSSDPACQPLSADCSQYCYSKWQSCSVFSGSKSKFKIFQNCSPLRLHGIQTFSCQSCVQCVGPKLPKLKKKKR